MGLQRWKLERVEFYGEGFGPMEVWGCRGWEGVRSGCGMSKVVVKRLDWGIWDSES